MTQEKLTPPRNLLKCEALMPACSCWRPIVVPGSEATETANASYPTEFDLPASSADSAAPALTRKVPQAP